MIKIRDYKSVDYPSLKAVLEETDMFDSDWDTEQVLRSKIKTQPGSILVAEDNEKVVGCIYILFDYWQSFIFRLAVHKDLQGKGVGTKLLKAAESSLRKQGANGVSLLVREEELPRLSGYYEKRGYTKSTRKHKFFYKKL